MKKIFFSIILIPLILTAGIFPKAGTTAAPFLKIGVGARAVAMGGNFVALANDATALYWNPAAITELSGMNISATHSNWIAGTNHGAILFALPISDAAGFGLELTYLTSGDIEQTTINEPDGNGIYYNATDFSMGIAYGRKLTDQFSVAVKAKYILQTIFNEEASTFVVDFGTLYKTEFKGLRIGMNMSNFGGNLQMQGNDLSLVQTDPQTGQEYESVLKTETWPLPIVFRVGIAFDLIGLDESLIQNPENRVTVAIDGTHPNDNNETIGLGLEYEWNNTLALRSGYKNNHDVQKLSFGAGLKFRLSGFLFNIDYAYADFGDLEKVQRFTAGIIF